MMEEMGQRHDGYIEGEAGAGRLLIAPCDTPALHLDLIAIHFPQLEAS